MSAPPDRDVPGHLSSWTAVLAVAAPVVRGATRGPALAPALAVVVALVLAVDP